MLVQLVDVYYNKQLLGICIYKLRFGDDQSETVAIQFSDHKTY